MGILTFSYQNEFMYSNFLQKGYIGIFTYSSSFFFSCCQVAERWIDGWESNYWQVKTHLFIMKVADKQTCIDTFHGIV